jgi:hypothetical protein
MNPRAPPVSTVRPQTAGVVDAVDRLTRLGWPLGLTAIIAGVVLTFFLFGYTQIYWRNADMDFMVIHSVLALNDGKSQHYFDHPAYITILAVQYWFRLLHALGLLDAWSLSSMPSAADAAAFDAAMTRLVHASRLLALLIATGSILIFAALVRRITNDWRIALLAAEAFAFSGGVAVQTRILRSELIAACPVIFALMILILIGRRASAARPIGMAVAAGLCMLGLENKVQAIFLIGALPLVILPFGGAESASVRFWRGASGWLAVAAAALLATAAASLAWPLIATGFDQNLLEAADFHPPLIGRYGVYQAALAVLIVSSMIAFAVLWRVSAAETLASIAAVVAGASIALLLLNIAYNSANVITIANPLEKMLAFADDSTTAASRSAGSAILLLLKGIGAVLVRYTFVLYPSSRPTMFLVWLIVPGIVLLWRRGERQPAIQALMLLLAAIGIDALGMRRGLKNDYFVFTDPLIILAGVILLIRLVDLRFHKRAFAVGAALVLLHVTVGQADPVSLTFKRSGPEPICEWNEAYLPLLPLPWCAAPPVPP